MKGGSSRVWIVYAALFAMAWGVRAAYLAETSGHAAFRMPLIDAGEYHAIAQGWAEGRRPLDKMSWQPWGYPLILAQLYRVVGPSVVAAKLLQITVGATTCVLAAALAFSCWPRPASRWIAGLAVAFYGPLVYHDGELLAEPWAALGLTATALIAMSHRRSPRELTALALGALGAALLFIRPPALAGWLFLLPLAFWPEKRRPALSGRTIALHALWLAVGFILAAWPFTHSVREATGTTRWLPSSGGINLYIGNSANPCETINTRPGHEWENLVLRPELYGARTPDEQDAFFRGQALRDIRNHPRVFFGNLIAKARQFVSSREIPRNIDVYVMRAESRLLRPLVWRVGGFGFPFGIVFGLALIGLFVRRPPSFGLFLGIAGYGAAIVAVHVCDRYRIPVIPLFLVLAAFGSLALFDAARAGRIRRLAVQCILVFLAGVAVSVGGPFCAERLNYDSEFHRLVAVTAYEQKDFATADLHARKAIEENPAESLAWNQLGLLDIQRGDLEAATRHFRHAVEMDPTCAPAWFNLGKAAAIRGEAAQAIDCFRQGLTHAPAHLPAWIDLGDLLIAAKRPDEAAACYREVLRIRPDFPPAQRRIERMRSQP